MRQGRTASPPLHCLGVGFQGLRQKVRIYSAYQVQAKTLRYTPGPRTVKCQANNRFRTPTSTRYLHSLGSRLTAVITRFPSRNKNNTNARRCRKEIPRRLHSCAGCEQERVVSPCSPHSADLQQPEHSYPVLPASLAKNSPTHLFGSPATPQDRPEIGVRRRQAGGVVSKFHGGQKHLWRFEEHGRIGSAARDAKENFDSIAGWREQERRHGSVVVALDPNSKVRIKGDLCCCYTT